MEYLNQTFQPISIWLSNFNNLSITAMFFASFVTIVSFYIFEKGKLKSFIFGFGFVPYFIMIVFHLSHFDSLKQRIKLHGFEIIIIDFFIVQPFFFLSFIISTLVLIFPFFSNTKWRQIIIVGLIALMIVLNICLFHMISIPSTKGR